MFAITKYPISLGVKPDNIIIPKGTQVRIATDEEIFEHLDAASLVQPLIIQCLYTMPPELCALVYNAKFSIVPFKAVILQS
tara:strand:+ start:73 stop:315 length:243 start_codon:yes stop_codon:yes gene_type:complete